MDELTLTAKTYKETIECVKKTYDTHFSMLSYIVNTIKKIQWDEFTDDQKLITENTVLLVGLLYNMCKVKLVLSSNNDKEPNSVNRSEVNKSIGDAKTVMDELGVKNDITKVAYDNE